jgi:hypothetical protein
MITVRANRRPHTVAGVNQVLRQPTADKAGRAGDEYG